MIDTKELRRLAQAATPGPWVAAGPSFGESLPKYLNEVAVDREGDEDDGYSICNAPIGLNEECSDDMAFIAEANPLTIEELLDRLEAAEKAVTEAYQRGYATGQEEIAAELEFAKREIANLHDDISEWMDKCNALRAKIERMERQEPVAWCATDETGTIIEALGMNQSRRFDTALYLAPGAQPAPSVPDGWQLVPIEPTIHMCIQGDNSRANIDDCTRTPAIYRAMLAAAPKPEAKP